MIFASFGVNFWKGTFYHCNGDTFSSLSNDQISYLTNPYKWGSLSTLQQKTYITSAPECLAADWISSTIPTSKEIYHQRWFTFISVIFYVCRMWYAAV